jgi:UDP-N-acetylenolpyruvoylglucosamine reductase
MNGKIIMEMDDCALRKICFLLYCVERIQGEGDALHAGAFKRTDGIIPSLLIDKCGLKGYKIGGAEISKKHAGFIVNSGGATAEDINDLLSYIKAKIFKEFGANLEEEILYIE